MQICENLETGLTGQLFFLTRRLGRKTEVSSEAFSPEKDVDLVDVSAVEPDRMGRLRGHVLKGEKVVGHLRRSGHFRGALEAQQQQVEHQAEELDDEGGELQAANDAVRVGVIHVFVVDDHVVLGRHVIGDVVIHDQTQQSGDGGGGRGNKERRRRKRRRRKWRRGGKELT